jgi:hypothetical protein
LLDTTVIFVARRHNFSTAVEYLIPQSAFEFKEIDATNTSLG